MAIEAGADDDPKDEATLFREAMRDVRPIKPSGQLPPVRRRVRARVRLARVPPESGEPARHPQGTDLYELQPGDELAFRRGGISERVLRRLRRGQYRVDAQLDLHGLSLAQALPQLQGFLDEARTRCLACVRIIHGKGLRSGNRGPVLKNSVNAQLRATPAVLAFASARPAAGGTGATLVLLARA
jgi:DNA-nicking Smr family endonuclease